MKILITGGAGFIGSYLSRVLIEKGHQVSVVDDLSTGFRDNLDGLDLDFIEASILDGEALRVAAEGVDSIVHLAALGSVPRSIRDPLATHHANATGTLRVLEAARGSGAHVVAASSSSVYGLNPALPKSERDWVRPMSPYAVTKLATEQYVLAYQQSFGLDTLAFRFFNVYGPGQRAGHAYAAVIPIFIEATLRGDALPINGDGSNSRDFTFVGTVSGILADAVERRVSHPEPVNLAFGTNTTLVELVRQISSVCGVNTIVEHGPPRLGDVPHSQADNAVLRRLFPAIEPVSLAAGLTQTLEWFKEKA